ncbi:site-specific DNA-methyltransferase [Ruminococcus callidus]
MTTTTEFQLVDINKLVPYANNARTHNKEQILKLRSSLREFGFVNPVIIDREYNVLAGHGRIEAAKAENISEVPCVFADHLTEAQKKAYILADNRMALDAGWDEELLSVEMQELQELGFDLSMTGFDEKELTDLLGADADGEAKEDDFDLSAALEKAAFVQRDDIWTVGRHKLMCGDATSAEDVSALMGDTKANLILTDPPYGVSFKSASGLTIQNDSMKNEEFYTFLLSSFQRMAEHLEKGGSAYVFHADTEGLNFRKAFIDAGFHLAGCCIWVKDSLVLGRSDYQWQHEPVLYGFMQNGKHHWYSDRKQTTIWHFDKPKRNANHPTSKPLDLLGYPIGNSTQENGVVMDTFGGSGSTLMACEQMNRICYTMELDEKYASVILRRYVEDTGNADGVYVVRDGKQIAYSELVKEVELSDD